MLLAAEIITALLSVCLPVGLAVYLCASLKDGWKWLLSGAAVYVLAGMLCYYGILTFLFSFSGFTDFSITQPYAYAFISALLEAILVVGITWLVFKVMSHQGTGLMEALTYAVGMSGIASLLLVGVNSLALFMTPAEGLQAGPILAAGIERACVLLVQITWCLWIMIGLQYKKPVMFVCAFLIEVLYTVFATIMHSIWGTALWESTGMQVIVACTMGVSLYRIYQMDQKIKKAQAIKAKKEAEAAKAAAASGTQTSLLSNKKKTEPSRKKAESTKTTDTDSVSSSDTVPNSGTDTDTVSRSDTDADSGTNTGTDTVSRSDSQ